MSHPTPPSAPKSGNAAQMDASQKLSPYKFSVVITLVFVACALLSNGINDLSTAGLLFLPVLALVVGSVILWHRLNNAKKPGHVGYYRLNLWAASGCIFSYCVLWLVFSQRSFHGHSYWLQAISLLALGVVSLLLLFVAFMTAAFIMEPTNEESTSWLPSKCDEMRAGIKNEPLWAIALFFVLFLGVAYLFGFALAFHDQSTLAKTKNKMPALYMVNLSSSDDNDKAHPSGSSSKENAKTGEDERSGASIPPSGRGAASANNEDEEFCFYFDERKANVSQSDANCDGSNPKRFQTEYSTKVFNACSHQALIAKLRKAIENDTRIKINLLGHSDKEPIYASGSGYASNYELSRSRAENVQYQILDALRINGLNVDNIRWTIFAAADAPLARINRGAITHAMFPPSELAKIDIHPNSERKFFLDQIERRMSTEAQDDILPAQQKRVVIATIEEIRDTGVVLPPDQERRLTAGQDEANIKLTSLQEDQKEHLAQSQSKPLELIDYMYFSIYTITTTGYGDIMPTTSYAKFVTSLANICEVLFLVVFFNALISIKGDKQDEKARLPGVIGDQAEPQDESTLENPRVRKANFPGRNPT
ncbi:MAG: hypothetical protein H7Z16_13585 [Pyrinomonadaceae bacterium]|nr:hypothetical protein [Pyrinomonadaceae bacterium]